VKIPITARLLSGNEKDVKQCTYTLSDPNGALAVLDWLPRTELRTEFAKPIQFNKEQSAKIGINMSAHYIVTTAGDVGGQLKSGTAYELLPPQEIVLASGTVHQGHGVYFKLRPSTQTTLEGMKLFSAICAVPRGWRGGCLKLQCEAVGVERGLIPGIERHVGSGTALFGVALYMEGDVEAEKLADRVARCQQEFFAASSADTNQGESGFGSVALWHSRPLGSLWGVNKVFLPSNAGAAEAELLTQVFDAKPIATPNEKVPTLVLAEARSLQLAAHALQACTAETNKRDQPRGPSPASIASGGQAGSEKRPSVSQPAVPAAQVVSLKLAQNKADTIAGAGVADTKNVAVKHAGSSGHSLPQAASAGAGKVSAGEREADEAKLPLEASANNSIGREQLSQGVSRQLWYFLAALWAAVLTYILAPFAVDSLRRRLKKRRLRRSCTDRSPSAIQNA
jgi:hypothetical protein